MAYKFQNISVLVVESSEPMAALARDVLTTFGIKKIYSAYDIQKGFDISRHEKPDLVITDWLGDSNDGLALIKLLRTDSRSPDPLIPIILMTGFTYKDKIFAARDAGISELLVKPYTAHSMYHKIENLIEKPKAFVKTDSFLGPDRRHRMEDVPDKEKRTAEPLVIKSSLSTKKPTK